MPYLFVHFFFFFGKTHMICTDSSEYNKGRWSEFLIQSQSIRTLLIKYKKHKNEK